MMQCIELSRRSLSEQIETACVLEAAAAKPGNVHPGARFSDLCFADFVHSATIAASHLGQAREMGVGPAILEAVHHVHREVGVNTNLGIALLIAPLAAVAPSIPLSKGIPRVLESLSRHDTNCIYEAIRVANPGGLGQVEEGDVRGAPNLSIMEAMRLAEDRDLIAWQYTHSFETVVGEPRDEFVRRVQSGTAWETAVIELQLSLLQHHPDSLIARKCGRKVALNASQTAAQVIARGGPQTVQGANALREFDSWLREDGHRRNPGTTADLIAAILFATIRDNLWTPPGSITVPVEGQV